MKKICFTFLLLLSLFFISCGGNSGSPSQVQQASPTVAATPTPAALSAEQVIQKLKAAGLPIKEIFPFTAETDTNHLLGRPGQYISKAAWHDSRLEMLSTDGIHHDVSDGGGVETFANLTEATNRFNYVQTISKSSSLFAEYDYQQGLYILRVSAILTPKQAEAYSDAFKKIVG